ncbi:MAG: hypothetical protein A2902_05695 [Elusimicrobia bacterium RIFCSPLOWO2_01_FULL_64_13]|nr:MAG: hypothetical protein A2636_01030 [Elusimicrobia bacterium RIFCSPHIGHO2_01_FULL_64_10]OGR94248.1 MAG: hypothetical protein A2902_05695 [Elusimicrobia bacterium RIFCSPLOWO2_01_FULL_64_13]
MNRTIVEVAMEIAYSPDALRSISAKFGPDAVQACAMSNSVGGIGPLLRERIPALAKAGASIAGVSLLYENVWVQDFYLWGQIYIQKIKVGDMIRGVLSDPGISFDLEMPDGRACPVKVWKTDLSGAPVYLLDSPGVSDVVYPGPEDAPEDHPNPDAWVTEHKLRQYWLAGRGTLALLKALDLRPGLIVQSETPAFFANHFLVTDAFQKDPFFKDTRYVFNDHTPLEYAHPFWNESDTLRARVDPRYARDKKFWNAERRGVDVTRLLIGVSDATYGVSRKHGQVMRAMPSLKGLEEKIGSITNGVSVPFWRDPSFEGFEGLSDAELIERKEKRKAEMVLWLWKKYRLWVDWRSKVKGKCFVNWTRRVTTYKRFDVLEALLKNPALKKRFLETDIVLLIGGRIHQNDDLSQNVMFTLLDLVTTQAELRDRIIVLNNYNVWIAPEIFRGIDASIMLADDGREASATGFMKAQVNGAAVVASPDGAVPESVRFAGPGVPAEEVNGFEVPYVHGRPEPQGLLAALEELDRATRDPAARARMVRASFRASGAVSVDRMAGEMIKLFNYVSSKKA